MTDQQVDQAAIAAPRECPAAAGEYDFRRHVNRVRHQFLAGLEMISQVAAEALTDTDGQPEVFSRELRLMGEQSRSLAEEAGRLLQPSRFAGDPAEVGSLWTKARHDLKNHLIVIGYRCEELAHEDLQHFSRYAACLDEIATNYRDCLGLLSSPDSSQTQGRPTGGQPPVPSSARRALEVVLAPLDDEFAFEPGNILVVEDELVHRTRLTELLVALGHRVVAVADGETALAELDRGGFDLVLLDLHMAGKSGYEVLDEMKREPSFRSIPVVVISANDDVENAASCIYRGADDYLPKPFDQRLLRARLRSSLIRSRLQKERLEQFREIERQRCRADNLLYQLFPHAVVQELLASEEIRPDAVAARRHRDVAVMFCDIVGFTAFCDTRDPNEVVCRLRVLFEEFERIAEVHQLQKIKTIGDCVMVGGGLHALRENPVMDCLRAANEMVAAAPRLCQWQVRVGIHCGPVVVGIVGQRQFCYDLWGDTVNVAARVQGEAEPGQIVITERAWQSVAGECRGEASRVELKNRGVVEIVRFSRFRAKKS